MPDFRKFFGALTGLALLASCGTADEPNVFRVGIGGKYYGRAQCAVVSPAPNDTLDCQVRRTSSDGEIVLQGLYRRHREADPDRISMMLVVGVPPYTPDLAIALPHNANLAPGEQAADAASLLCEALETYGEIAAECLAETPRAGTSVVRVHMSSSPDCDLLASLSDGLIRVMLRSACDRDPWQATHQHLLSNFEPLKLWYLRRSQQGE